MGYRVWLITFLGPKKREDYLKDSSSRNIFNALDTCRATVGPVSNEGVASSSTHFSLYISRIFLSLYIVHPPHSLYFILADFRERKLVAFDSINPSFTSVSLSVVIFKTVLLQKANLPVSFYFLLFFHIFCL